MSAWWYRGRARDRQGGTKGEGGTETETKRVFETILLIYTF